jgi:hypothetical protein
MANPVGRPSTYNEIVARKICTLLAQGTCLTAICRQEGMPGLTTVYQWLDKHPEFEKAYARARLDQADTLVAEIMEIADEAQNDFVQDSEGNTVLNREAIERSRLRIDARKWVAAKLKPRKYGELQRLEVDGEIRHRPIPPDISPEEAEKHYLDYMGTPN